MKKRMTPETDFPDLWDLRGYWGACFIQVDSDGDGISDAAEDYYEEHPEEWEERNEFLESHGMGTRDYDDYIGEDADGPETPEGAISGGGDPGDPDVNEYGYDYDDWDDMSENQRTAIGRSHGDHWHGQPPPDTGGNDDDGDEGSGSLPDDGDKGSGSFSEDRSLERLNGDGPWPRRVRNRAGEAVTRPLVPRDGL